MKCPREDCTNEARIHAVYGVMICSSCLEKDEQVVRPGELPEFAVQSKADRVQGERDRNMGEIEQPFIGNKPNPQFAKIYPDKAHDYFTPEQLQNME